VSADRDAAPAAASVAAGSTRPASAPFLTGALRVFEMSLGEMLWSRRTIFMALIVGSPVILAVVARIVQSSGVAPLRINGVRADAAAMFGMMVWVFFLRFIVPVLGVFYGTSLIADEVDEKTITYLFTRPIRRGSVLVGKYLAYLVCTSLVVLPAITLVYFLVVPFGEVAASFRWLLIDLGLLAIGLAAYGALFALVGAVLKRPLVVGLVFAFGWEQLAMVLPGYLRRFTIAHYLQAMVPHAMPSDGVTSLLQAVFNESPPVWASLAALAAITAGCLVLAARAVERREYVLEQ
jgi:ABC-2 type transport system permease protein